jgi:hypothetical protein
MLTEENKNSFFNKHICRYICSIYRNYSTQALKSKYIYISSGSYKKSIYTLRLSLPEIINYIN